MSGAAKNPFGKNSWGGKYVGSWKNVVTGKAKIGDALNLHSFGSYKGSGIDQHINNAFGGKSYTPEALASEDPKLLLAQSGGAPLLTQIALGADVETALAGYFGRNTGEDWDVYQENLNPNEKAAIDNVRTQLTQIQSNTNLRNQAVQKIVQDFPNIVQQTAPMVAEAKRLAGQEFDDASKQYMDFALKSVGAKYAAGGNLSSGAMAQASADSATKLGMERLNYTTGRGDVAYERGANDLLGSWQAKYNEANALRNFQQTMLGQGVSQGFSANQAYLNRKQNADMTNASFANQKALADQASQNAMMGSLGSLAGTAIGAYFGGPVGAAAGSQIGGILGGGQSGSYQNSAAYFGVNDRQYAPPKLRNPYTGGY